MDYKNLKYFMTTQKFTKCQACQLKFLSRFTFIISYTAGKNNFKVVILTHRPYNSLANNSNNQQ